MKTQDRNKLKKLLLENKERIIKDIEQTNENITGSAFGDGDMADVATNAWDRMVNMGISERELEKLKEVDAALEKVSNKSYGACIDCKEDINLERLNAIPEAKRCLNCQSEFDRNNRLMV